MAIFAVIADAGVNGSLASDAYVENVMVLDPSQKSEMELALGKPLLDCKPFGLAIGDLFNGENWTRNVDGEQRTLPIQET